MADALWSAVDRGQRRVRLHRAESIAMRESKAAAASPRRPRSVGMRTRAAAYEKDVILWSEDQARALRARRFAKLDIEHLADEIEDVGKSEKRELASRMAVLLAHLLKWRVQPENRTNSWRVTISDQRRRIALAIKETPSLRAVMREPVWQEDMWLDARAQGRKETGLDELPEACPWTMDEAADGDFWPD
jgi:hypothetical protein